MRTKTGDAAQSLELANDLTYEASMRRQPGLRPAAEQLELFRHLLDTTSDLILLIDPRSERLIDANDTAASRLGYTREELLRLSVSALTHAGAAQSWSERGCAADLGASWVMDDVYRCKDGQCFPVEISVSCVEYAQQSVLVTFARDITERKRNEARIAHLSRVLQMHSSTNAAVLRIRDGDELLREACRVATEVGGYDRCTLWIAEPDGQRARATFSSGEVVDFPGPNLMELSNGSEPDQSFTSYALRTGELTICNDLGRSALPIAMRGRLMDLGYKSLVAMPLIVGGRRMGVLLLASRDVNLVSHEEIALLQDLQSNLAFALESGQTAGAAEYLVYFDPLTGLAKRTLFCERLALALRDMSGSRKNLTIVAFDIRGLAQINDSFGWRIGDLLLQCVSERLKRSSPAQEHVGHVGGGTFLLFKPALRASVEDIAAQLQGSIFAEPFEIAGHTLRVSCLLGIACFPGDGQRADLLVQNAEAALNRAKEIGEQYQTYDSKTHREAAQRLKLEHKLATALDADQFVLHYQPQKNIATGRIESVEALLRWNDPEEGLLEPARFIPTLESSGMIVLVGEWVLKHATSDCRRWRALGLGPVRVAINVSALQLRRRSFVAEVLSAADGLNGAGYGLDLEITESALLQDIDTATLCLQELRANGIKIALDDFGTGYSSLGLLSRLPVDALKIDRSFVSGLPHDPACVALTSSIIQLATGFGLETIAEGVETLEQFEKLRELHCAQAQGFLLSPAVPLAQIEVMLASVPTRQARTEP